MGIIRDIRRLKEPSSFRGWAYRIVGNKAADWLRRAKRRRELHGTLVRQDQNVGERAPPGENETDVQTRVRRGIRMLPAIDRQILSLKYLDRLSTREIADALEIPQGTVKSRLFHARARLKQILQGDDQ